MARKASPDERALWRTATRGIARYRPDDEEPPLPEPPTPPIAAPAKKVAAGARHLAPPGMGLDRRSATRLRRGEMAIAARLDLHGMTQDEAHRALVRFVERAHDEGKRTVLVITGKGTASGEGVLRRAVPRWLAEPQCRAKVLATEPARPQHGGDGALYVLLRRKRA
jgi:DNA-nicking Smr family endonuclease